MKKLIISVVICLSLAALSGCMAVVAGGAAAGGTAAWLAQKLTQEFNASYEKTVAATEKALKSLKLEVIKKTADANVTQIKSESLDGKEIWIDIRRVAEKSTKVEVRVGVVSPDKDVCQEILTAIQRYL